MPIDCAKCGKTVQDKRALRGHIRMGHRELDDEKSEEVFQRSTQTERPDKMDALEEYALACKMDECLEEVQPDELQKVISHSDEIEEVNDYDRLKQRVQQKKESAKKRLVGGGE